MQDLKKFQRDQNMYFLKFKHLYGTEDVTVPYCGMVERPNMGRLQHLTLGGML